MLDSAAPDPGRVNRFGYLTGGARVCGGRKHRMSFHHYLIFLQGSHLYLSFLQQPFVFPDSSLPPRHDSFSLSAA